MPFALNAAVVIKPIGKTGRVVERSRDGRYRVRVGSVVMACREEDLEDAAGADRNRKRGKSGAKKAESVGGSTAAGPGDGAPLSRTERQRLASLDLHGFTVDEALAKVNERLDLALRAGFDRLDIIHGRSSGRIKIAVHRLLGEIAAVRHFEVAPHNPGVTRVFL